MVMAIIKCISCCCAYVLYSDFKWSFVMVLSVLNVTSDDAVAIVRLIMLLIGEVNIYDYNWLIPSYSNQL